MGYEGTVVISIAFNTAGVVTDAQFSRKCPYPSLNDQALKAAWRIHPYHVGMINGQITSGSDTVTYIFKDGQVIVKSLLKKD